MYFHCYVINLQNRQNSPSLLFQVLKQTSTSCFYIFRTSVVTLYNSFGQQLVIYSGNDESVKPLSYQKYYNITDVLHRQYHAAWQIMTLHLSYSKCLEIYVYRVQGEPHLDKSLLKYLNSATYFRTNWKCINKRSNYFICSYTTCNASSENILTLLTL